MTGTEYADLVYRYILENYTRKYGILVQPEVRLGVTLNGTRRYVDLLLFNPKTNTHLIIECKWQETRGTTQEKLDYALLDLDACRFDGILVYAGPGFTEGAVARLRAHPKAVYCLPPPDLQSEYLHVGDVNQGTWQLDDEISIHFGLFDVFQGHQGVLSLNPLK